MGQHVSPQVLLVLGSKAALAALVGPQARVLRHVGLQKEWGVGRGISWVRTELPQSRHGTYPLKWIWEELGKKYKPDQGLVLYA